MFRAVGSQPSGVSIGPKDDMDYTRRLDISYDVRLLLSQVKRKLTWSLQYFSKSSDKGTPYERSDPLSSEDFHTPLSASRARSSEDNHEYVEADDDVQRPNDRDVVNDPDSIPNPFSYPPRNEPW
jgi:hypothetical protein